MRHSSGKYAGPTLQEDLDDIKRYMTARGKALDREELLLETDLAVCDVGGQSAGVWAVCDVGGQSVGVWAVCDVGGQSAGVWAVCDVGGAERGGVGGM